MVVVWTAEMVAEGRSRSWSMWAHVPLCRDLLKRTLKFRSLVQENNCRKRHLGPGIPFCSFITRRVLLLKFYQSSHRFFPASEAQNHKHEMILRTGLKPALVNISDSPKRQYTSLWCAVKFSELSSANWFLVIITVCQEFQNKETLKYILPKYSQTSI